MKTRSFYLVTAQAVLSACLLQALPSWADTPPTPTPAGPTSGSDTPWYVSPGVGLILTILHR